MKHRIPANGLAAPRPPRPRKLLSGLHRLIGASGALLLLGGCATAVIPPEKPANAVCVYLCDYGVHSSLLLPTGHRRFVEYCFGDWAYTALDRTSWHDVIGALFFSPQSSLGVRIVDQPDDADKPLILNGVKREIPLWVDADTCKLIVEEMGHRWHRSASTALLNTDPGYGFNFVKYDEHYWAMHNCNWITADLLSRLGCKVEGFPLLSDFQVVPKPTAPPPRHFGK